MITLAPTTLEGHGVRLEPLSTLHVDALVDAASDGRLWELWFTSVPTPDQTASYVANALAGFDAGSLTSKIKLLYITTDLKFTF